MTDTTHLGLPYLDAAQAQRHVTHNDALRMLDALVQLSVTARNVVTAPASPAEGARWLVGAGATGAFAGNANNVAAFQDGVWRFFVPQKGWLAYVESEGVILVFDGTNWSDLGLALHVLQDLTQLGIGTAADTTNVLAAKLNAALFTAKSTAEGGTGDLRTTLNKSTAANTVSQLYQDGFSGRAETGLTGDDNFHVKVSPDGSTWHEAVNVDRNTGKVDFPSGTTALKTYAFRVDFNGVDYLGFPASAFTKVPFPHKAFDHGSYYDATGFKWTPPSGVVFLNAAFAFKNAAIAVGSPIICAIFKNGEALATNRLFEAFALAAAANADAGASVSGFDVCNGSDFYECFAYVGSTGAATLYGDAPISYFGGAWIGTTS